MLGASELPHVIVSIATVISHTSGGERCRAKPPSKPARGIKNCQYYSEIDPHRWRPPTGKTRRSGIRKLNQRLHVCAGRSVAFYEASRSATSESRNQNGDNSSQFSTLIVPPRPHTRHASAHAIRRGLAAPFSCGSTFPRSSSIIAG